ncbi:MAG: family 10 glycosylhydrolase [Cyclobacteriaceae bacterium]|nr:family 10 glycosylhydrolase [Cyclobacteriaceae bacterium]MCH8515683.1 family 10 glycosylhydrolase [Cyclobacteriaceae bacterium]
MIITNNYKSSRFFFTALFIVLVSGCSVLQQQDAIPEKREFRGFWVATVLNIDWPQHPKDELEKQKRDFIEILDFYQNLNFNAAIVQIRAVGDAFYPSDLAPWSKYLSGEQGKSLEGHENILEWMIEACHERGMEFHAWLNPYRATFNLDTTQLSKDHDYYLHPEWMVQYGNKFYYDPGIPDVEDHLMKIIREIVVNYDIDALHFDDYFYPYRIEGEEFGDEASYSQYRHSEDQTRADWRRENVNRLIERIHQESKAEKAHVQFGISPFGVWRNFDIDPRGSDSRAGQTNFDDLFADVLQWIEAGTIDYLLPQIYWSLDYELASHKKLINWWVNHAGNTNLYVGNGPYKIKNDRDKAWNKKKELAQQVDYARKQSRVQGNAFFSAKSLMQVDEKYLKSLRKVTYAHPSLPPAAPYATQLPSRPIILNWRENNGVYVLKLDAKEMETIRYVMVYGSEDSRSININDPRNIKSKISVKGRLSDEGFYKFEIDAAQLAGNHLMGITLIDRFGMESFAEIIRLDHSK